MKKLEMSAFKGFSITPKFVFGGIAGSASGMGTTESPAQFKFTWRGCINGYDCVDIDFEDCTHECGRQMRDSNGNNMCD
jgi:hypothetical protein